MNRWRQLAAQGQSLRLDFAEAEIAAALDAWDRAGKTRRLWARDATLWTGGNEGDWLGWLRVVERQISGIKRFGPIEEEARAGGFTHALLLGMGGSSLCAEVLRETHRPSPGHPDLLVLDSTDPSQVRSVERRIDPARTLFIVSSKSGTTLEPSILKDYFFERVAQRLDPAAAGEHFVAITDPGSPLEHEARKNRYRAIYHGLPDIGGRYSALSDFGMVPAAILGLDVGRFLARAGAMVRACGPEVPAAENPGVVLGIVLGLLARHGRDKVTLLSSPGLRALGGWLEQLLAESTGKEGAGLIPIDGEPVGEVDLYGEDRVFVYLKLDGDSDAAQGSAVDRLEQAGHPIVRLVVGDRYDLGQEFFRWEIATAVAGSILGVNPFDQPDVEASKVETRRLTAAYEKTGSLPPEEPIARGEGMALFADPVQAEALRRSAPEPSAGALLAAHLDGLSGGDYFALLAYVERSSENDHPLQAVRLAVRDAKRVATSLGYGPRFLHSTGQVYKGGPASGLFLQITCEEEADLPVPGRRYSFGVVKAAQARGDLEVLSERGRRVLRVHLGRDVARGLNRLRQIVVDVLS